MSRLARAVLVGGLIAVISTVLLRMFPERNTYLSLPGYLIAFVLNGGDHQRYIGDVGWYVVPPLANFLFYSLVVYAFLSSRGKYAGRFRSNKDFHA
jgi:hypothetical protein